MATRANVVQTKFSAPTKLFFAPNLFPLELNQSGSLNSGKWPLLLFLLWDDCVRGLTASINQCEADFIFYAGGASAPTLGRTERARMPQRHSAWLHCAEWRSAPRAVVFRVVLTFCIIAFCRKTFITLANSIDCQCSLEHQFLTVLHATLLNVSLLNVVAHLT